MHGLENNFQLSTMELKFNEQKNKMKSHGPTSKLWVQYLNMVDLFKSNIRADRIGELLNHTQSQVKKIVFVCILKVTISSICRQAMHPFFAASGHNNYTKSIQIYLQDMQALSRSNPAVHEFFSKGNFVTRRSNRYWGGLPDDLIIEQVKWQLKFIYSAARETSFHIFSISPIYYVSELKKRNQMSENKKIFLDCKGKRGRKVQSLLS